MSLPPILVDTVISTIEQTGNYFIIDSEQLVSRPYHDLQIDTQTEMQKKSSAIEKVTNIKNNICDKHFQVLEGKLKREETSLIKSLNSTTNKLRYEVKKLDIDKQNNELDIKKRVDPLKDYSYDELQLNNSCSRLGINGSAFYLNKKLRFPVRHKISTTRLPPDVQLAQNLLKSRRYMNERLICSAPSTILNLDGDVGIDRNEKWPRGGDDGGDSGRNYNKGYNYVAKRDVIDRSARPHVDRDHMEARERDRDAVKLPCLQRESSSLTRLTKSGSCQHVKFHNLMGNERSNDTGRLTRANTFHVDVGHGERDDYKYPREKIDIVSALLEKFPNSLRLERPTTEQRMTGSRRKSSIAPRVTQKLMMRDTKHVQSKINNFFSAVFHVEPKVTKEPKVEVEFSQNKRRGSEMLGMTKLMGLYGQVLAQTASAIQETNMDSESMDFQAWMEIGRKELDEHKRLKKALEPSTNDGKIHDTDSSNGSQVARNEKLIEKLALKKWRELSWRLTKKGISKEYAGDISINRLMGIDVMGENKRKITGIPVNSAGRALRQSTTYKMQKLVDKMIKSKNKFQQFEVNELKRRLDEGETIDSIMHMVTEPKQPDNEPTELTVTDDSV